MSDSLYATGVRPIIDDFLLEESKKVRDYGSYWSASSAGYCMRKNIFQRLGVPEVNPEPRKQRVFTAGHIFHDWIQQLTVKAGVSVAQEVELQDEGLMVRGHFDDLVLIQDITDRPLNRIIPTGPGQIPPLQEIEQNLILYDYKTTNSRSFMWAKKQLKETGENPMSYYHRMQLGTYMYMLRQRKNLWVGDEATGTLIKGVDTLVEARILKIEKDNLMMGEQQLIWDDQLEQEVVAYWTELNKWWDAKKIPPCTCADHENGFLAKEAYNPYFYGKEPCSLAWYELCKREGKLKEVSDV